MLSVVNGLSQTDYTYNSRGLRTSTKNYFYGLLVSQTEYTYNLAGLATSLVNRDSEGNVLSSFSYTYQFDGNVSSETDHNGIVTNYTYDLLGRLIAEVSGASSKYYTYDNSGNRTKVIVDGVSQVLYTYNDKGQLVTETKTNGETSEVISYTYDANGNLISKAEGIKTTDYIYDTFGRMVAADGSTYTYRPDGLRASKTVDDHSQRFSYVNGKVVNDRNKKYTYGLELIKSNTAYFLYNIHGDVIQMVNPSGALLKTYNYDAYGNELTRDLDDTNPFRYCGEYYDTETGFIYLRARYYDPMVGRFTTLDGINNIITSIPLTNNLYLYCIDNPIRYVDRTGEFWQEFWEAFKEAVSQHGTQLATAGAISQADSVAPGPADIAAGIFALSILFVCATKAYDDTISLDFTISIPKTKVKTEVETITDVISIPYENKVNLFPQNPYDFLPNGLILKQYVPIGCGSNGGIFKWELPGTNILVFEWNEDYKNGSHYHAFMPADKNKHTKDIIHYYPGSIIPEPWNTVYFGGK